MKILFKKKIAWLVLLGMFFCGGTVHAKSALEIDASVTTALKRFQKEVPGAKGLIAKAKGVLVFPSVIKAGIGLGGEYGVGALRIKGKTASYYNTMSGSFGLQLGGQVKSIYLLFMEDQALKNFRNSDGWKAGVDGSVALIHMGAAASVDTARTNQPILGFVLGQKGLMYNLSIEGSKFNKIDPD
ncbi:MAG: YSC84-related protein [Candidatus Omnitrophota bacterium]